MQGRFDVCGYLLQTLEEVDIEDFIGQGNSAGNSVQYAGIKSLGEGSCRLLGLDQVETMDYT